MRSISDWCTAVIQQVRFWPDHKSIELELRNHYIDHVRDLERIGFDSRLAEQRALQAMGDPVEVGKAMDKAHKRWLGWLWVVSRWCLILSIGITVCLAIRGEWRNLYGDVQHWMNAPTDYEDDGMYFTVRSENFERLAWKACNEEYELCGYTLRVPYAALWKSTYERETRYWFSAVMTAENWKFWEEAPRFKQTVWVRSSTGESAEGFKEINQTDYYMSESHEGLFKTTFELSASSFSECPEWVELTCPYGDGFTFHIDWGEVQE